MINSDTYLLQIFNFSTMFFLLSTGSLEAGYDGRTFRKPIHNRWITRRSNWEDVEKDELFDNGWYIENLRMNKATFDKIVAMVTSCWDNRNRWPHWNSHFTIRDRLAVTIHYLTHSSNIRQSGQIFGISKSRVVEFMKEVMPIIVHDIRQRHLRLPTTEAGWREISDGFESIAHFPNVCGAIDGSLIRIHRPKDYEGWYCRKGFPAMNAQAVVDHKRKFMSVSIRPGHCNDKTVFNRSAFGQTCMNILPRGHHFLGDAGYALKEYLLTPYHITEGMPDEEAHYNYLHSKTRIVVEGAFGMLKSRFRILQVNLPHSLGHSGQANVVIACMVLHNICIDAKDDLFDVVAPLDDEEDKIENVGNDILQLVAGEKRNRLKRYLFQNWKD